MIVGGCFVTGWRVSGLSGIVDLLVFLYIGFVYCVADWIAWFVVAICGFGCFRVGWFVSACGWLILVWVLC